MTAADPHPPAAAVGVQSEKLEVGGDFNPTIVQHGVDPSELSRLLAEQRRRPFQSNIPPLHDLPFLGRDDLLDRMHELLSDPTKGNVVVLYGQPGVGKSELAREYARKFKPQYTGGTFFIDARPETIAIDLARLARTCLGLADDLRIEDQAMRSLHIFGESPCLLIFDNVLSENDILPWLPSSGTEARAVITSVADCWDPGWQSLKVEPLADTTALQLVERIAGVEAATRYGKQLVEVAGGLPIQIVPACKSLRRDLRRGRDRDIPPALSPDAKHSFRGVYERLDPPAQLLLHAAACMNPQRIIRGEIEAHLLKGAGWSESEFDLRLDECLDLSVIDGGEELRIHGLFVAFLRETAPPDSIAGLLAQIVGVQAKRMVELAHQVAIAPNRTDLASALMAYPIGFAAGQATEISVDDGEIIGSALGELGQFTAARPWFERAVAEKGKGDVHGRVDHQSLGTSLHQVGNCLARTGEFAAARRWYERAVTEKEKGDIHVRIDHQSLGASLHQVGYCLSSTGEFAAARPWVERAVAAAEKGDVHGRVDHENLGASLHLVGYCLAGTGEFAAARPWVDRAVAAAEKGDVYCRVDHQSLGKSLHLVGYCLSNTGEFAAARPWFVRAVAEQEKGDVHGRVDHESLGSSLHMVGYCLSSTGAFAAARPWFERAVAEAEKGDVHGRVDHQSLGISLHQVGYCLSSSGEFAAAHPWFVRAVAQREKGDVHGRVDHQSLGTSLHQVGYCLSSTGEFGAARPWYERAVSEKEKGDVHGRVDHQSLGLGLHQMGYCLTGTGEFAAARPWFERAVAEKEKGDLHGRVDHESLGASLHQVGDCLSATGEFAAARPWFERAVAEKEKGDVHGRIYHQSLALSLRSGADCHRKLGLTDLAVKWIKRASALKGSGD